MFEYYRNACTKRVKINLTLEISTNSLNIVPDKNDMIGVYELVLKLGRCVKLSVWIMRRNCDRWRGPDVIMRSERIYRRRALRIKKRVANINFKFEIIFLASVVYLCVKLYQYFLPAGTPASLGSR